MAIQLWNPRQNYTRQEESLLHRTKRHRKLFRFLREHRAELFDHTFQEELASMYRDTGAGEEPKPPAMMAMAMLLQGYVGASDAEAVELTLVDLRWQMVLDCLGAETPAFSQGAFQSFRERMIAHDMDRRLLERTADLARKTRGFDPKKLPKTLRVAVDSSPLVGAGRVEDTINLLAHAARKLAICMAALLGWTVQEVCEAAGVTLLLESSIKKALDVDWSTDEAHIEAIHRLVEQLDSLKAWMEKRMPEELSQSPLKEKVETLERLRSQDLEPDPSHPGKMRIREGVAPDRQVSVEDPEMRHGRKSKTKRFDGYKRHIMTDLDEGIIVACAITPANQPEALAAPLLQEDLERQKLVIEELFIDRGYIKSSLATQVLEDGGDVICRPWTVGNNNGLFDKTKFKIEIDPRTITCPGGQTKPYRLGQVVEFEATICDGCPLRAQCTKASPGHGRTVTIAEDEDLQQELRRRMGTREGREKLRRRTSVEHQLSHVSRRQGRRARYRGVRKNLYDLRRAAALQNLELIQRTEQPAAENRKCS
jgi:IS5 family transposase